VVRLRYLYVGSSDTERDLAAWLALGSATMRWRFQHFGADVAAVAFDGGGQPAVLLAEHRPPGSVLPIFQVDDLDAACAHLRSNGWVVGGGPMGTPEGLAAVLVDPSGTEIALLAVERPRAMEGAYADPDNAHRVLRGDEEPPAAVRSDGPSPHTGVT
jgi:predicted enzyme related to lactoylglutathione lyase